MKSRLPDAYEAGRKSAIIARRMPRMRAFQLDQKFFLTRLAKRLCNQINSKQFVDKTINFLQSNILRICRDNSSAEEILKRANLTAHHGKNTILTRVKPALASLGSLLSHSFLWDTTFILNWPKTKIIIYMCFNDLLETGFLIIRFFFLLLDILESRSWTWRIYMTSFCSSRLF